MTPTEIASWTMMIFSHRMRALEICAQRMPNQPVDAVMREAERVLAWAGQQDDKGAKG